MLIRNTISQFIGRASSLIAGFIGLPIYLSYLGAENFGLVGIYLSLQAFMGLLDFGLPLNANRQISIYLSSKTKSLTICRFVRGFELIYALITFLGFILLYLSAHLLSQYWLNLDNLSIDQTKHALQIAALAAALRFPVNFYSNILFAHHRHLGANLVIAIATFFRVISAIAFFEFYEVSPQSFFYSQVIVNALELILLGFLFWSKQITYFFCMASFKELKETIGLSASLTAWSFSYFLQTQTDKIILSKFLTLHDFGIYSAAYSLAMGIAPLAYAVCNAIFPTLSRLVAQNKKTELDKQLKQTTKLTVLLLAPAACFLITQGRHIEPLLLTFTPYASDVIKLLPIMTIGVCFHGFCILTYNYRVAQNRTKPIFIITVIHIIPYGIMLYYLMQFYGIKGAALAFLITNTSITCWLWISLGALKARKNIWRENAILNIMACSVIIILGYILSFLVPSSFSEEYRLLWSMLNVGLLALCLGFILFRNEIKNFRR